MKALELNGSEAFYILEIKNAFRKRLKYNLCIHIFGDGMYMRKKIAYFVGDIGRDFQKTFGLHLTLEAEANGYDLFAFNNFPSHSSARVHDIGEKYVVDIPYLGDFDGIVVLPDTLDSEDVEELLKYKIGQDANCPVVSVRNGLGDAYQVLIDDHKTTYNLTQHLIKDHGMTRICYMSGPLSVGDAVARLNGFKDAMADAGLEFPEDAVFEGDFWNFKSVPATEQFLKAYDGKPQAIVFGNDHMAIGVCEELKKRGLKIPEDIAIIGYDETKEGQSYNPTLTTVRQPARELAVNAVQIINDVIDGKEVPKTTSILGSIIYNASCGCPEVKKEIDLANFYSILADNYIGIRLATSVTAEIQNIISEEDKLLFISEYARKFNISRAFLCLCTEEEDNDAPFSDKMLLKAILPFGSNEPAQEELFDRREIVPAKYYSGEERKCFIVLPIHHRNSVYGYLAIQGDDKDFTMYLSPIVTALALTYDDLRMQKEHSELIEIKRQNLMDSLTGIYNRRGFETNLNELAKSKDLDGKYISFLSVDLDNLKDINDTYGHYAGDEAIKIVADSLSAITSDTDIVARTGGDEFYLVLVSSDKNYHDNFATAIESEIERRNKNSMFKFAVHASVGICTVDSSEIENSAKYLQAADKMMYVNKINYKRKLINKTVDL